MGTAENVQNKSMRSAVATGQHYSHSVDAEVAMHSKIVEAHGDLLPCQYGMRILRWL